MQHFSLDIKSNVDFPPLDVQSVPISMENKNRRTSHEDFKSVCSSPGSSGFGSTTHSCDESSFYSGSSYSIPVKGRTFCSERSSTPPLSPFSISCSPQVQGYSPDFCPILGSSNNQASSKPLVRLTLTDLPSDEVMSKIKPAYRNVDPEKAAEWVQRNLNNFQMNYGVIPCNPKAMFTHAPEYRDGMAPFFKGFF